MAIFWKELADHLQIEYSPNCKAANVCLRHFGGNFPGFWSSSCGGGGASLQEHSFFGFMTESHNQWKDYAL